MPRALRWSWGGGGVLMSEVSLYDQGEEKRCGTMSAQVAGSSMRATSLFRAGDGAIDDPEQSLGVYVLLAT